MHPVLDHGLVTIICGFCVFKLQLKAMVLDDGHGELLFPRPLAQGRLVLFLILHRYAICEANRLSLRADHDVEQQARALLLHGTRVRCAHFQCFVLLEGAPDAPQRRCLVVQHEQHPAAALHSPIETGVFRIIVADIILKRVLPVSISTDPERNVPVQCPEFGMVFEAIEEVHDELTPPVAHKPAGWLSLPSQKFDHCAILMTLKGLRDWTDQPLAQVIEVKAVHAQVLELLLLVMPCVAMLHCEAHDAPELWQRDPSMLRLFDQERWPPLLAQAFLSDWIH
mmetsp:Transcript_77409/g.199249  ORF Transcript_77409/g.199249 Transcript_77409/m.199249 type:complete len:282 (+) Transcript_77409:859-1704(+)